VADSVCTLTGHDRIKGLRAGGDDYLPNPISFAELLVPARVLSRRRRAAEETTIGSAISNSTGFPTASRRQGLADAAAPRNSRLLEYLMKHAARWWTRHHSGWKRLGLSFRSAAQRLDVLSHCCRSKIDKGF